MNERIKLLAEQAAKEHGHTIKFSSEIAETLNSFAELIVEEMYVFMCNATDNNKPWPTFKEVKQHFGVEE